MSDDKLNQILTILERIDKKLTTSVSGAVTTTTSGHEIADDYDLDGKYGDEEIRRDPSAKYWPGESFAGRRMSETTAEYLDAFARYKDACAYANQKEGKEEKAKYIGYDRKSAARARGWAKRLRDGWKKASPKSELFDDEPPF